MPSNPPPQRIIDPLHRELAQHPLINRKLALHALLLSSRLGERVDPAKEAYARQLAAQGIGDFGDGLREVRFVEDEGGARDGDTVAETFVGEVEVDEGGDAVGGNAGRRGRRRERETGG